MVDIDGGQDLVLDFVWFALLLEEIFVIGEAGV
jgi:hypothetical protein